MTLSRVRGRGAFHALRAAVLDMVALPAGGATLLSAAVGEAHPAGVAIGPACASVPSLALIRRMRERSAVRPPA
ncbi:hypothetical protein HD597_012404 [Nonomuraea thailandensis]|uniref:Uncharacterized protein n=1 Tax=Nonomuraea thailandensis TaxID=1188745 RepID=A0A9X2GTT1_9ACTN|nr:hypothetical protein [Nonomuraea thailandensis]MCP2365384.1 hypothetical protein [Nonomuraea thailandensis]